MRRLPDPLSMQRTFPARLGALILSSSASLLVAASCGNSGGDDVVIVTEPLDYYEPCVASEECPDFTDCFVVDADYVDVIVTDSLCSNECTFDDECAIGGKCVLVDVSPLCYARCIDDFDCWEGYGCVDWDLDLDPVCLPI